MKKILMVLVTLALVCGSLFADVTPIGKGTQKDDVATHNLEADLNNSVFVFGFLNEHVAKEQLTDSLFTSSVGSTIIRKNHGESIVNDGAASTFFGWMIHSSENIAFQFDGTPLMSSDSAITDKYRIGYTGVITGVDEADFITKVNDVAVKNIVVDANQASSKPEVLAHTAHEGLQKGILTITFTPVYYAYDEEAANWEVTDFEHMPTASYFGTVTVKAVVKN
ncbi:MAG: hypothetical protein KBS81_06335 [Spirochaetales bacterium]|nr:hypothetical protein [Candidatus Physcosoma equi]